MPVWGLVGYQLYIYVIYFEVRTIVQGVYQILCSFLKCFAFLNSSSSALVIDLPLCAHTATEGKLRERGHSPEFILRLKKEHNI